MMQELYVIGMRTNQGTVYLKDAVVNDGEYEIKLGNHFQDARIISDLEACKGTVALFEHEAILSIYKINLEEVAE